MKEEIIQLIQDRINELKSHYDDMTDYEQVGCSYVINELVNIINLIDVNID